MITANGWMGKILWVDLATGATLARATPKTESFRLDLEAFDLRTLAVLPDE